eukprot:5382529-Amphidinium_carterae.1
MVSSTQQELVHMRHKLADERVASTELQEALQAAEQMMQTENFEEERSALQSELLHYSEEAHSWEVRLSMTDPPPLPSLEQHFETLAMAEFLENSLTPRVALAAEQRNAEEAMLLKMQLDTTENDVLRTSHCKNRKQPS